MSDAPAQAGQGGFTTRMQRTVEWGDCDPAGIIFYPTYYRWMDAASWHLFAEAGYSAARMRAEHLSLPLVHTECSFLSSPTFGETCIVESCVERLGGKHHRLAPSRERASGWAYPWRLRRNPAQGRAHHRDSRPQYGSTSAHSRRL